MCKNTNTASNAIIIKLTSSLLVDSSYKEAGSENATNKKKITEDKKDVHARKAVAPSICSNMRTKRSFL